MRLRDPAECAEVANQRVGDLLPGARYDTWTEPARERLHALYLALLRVCGQWERLAEHETTDEPAHRALMQRELEAGNRSAALRWYSQLKEALQQSLGMTPDARTEAMYERCVAGLQSLGPPFVGRAQLLGQVTAWLGMAAGDRPGGIVLRGPAGIGKSALCREIGVLARRRGWVVMRLDASETGRTYGTIASIVDSIILGERSALDRIGAPARAVLAQLSPLAAPASDLLGPLGRHQVVGAVRRLLLAAATDTDILLQVDDAHLIDDADVEVLVQLATAGAPVCLLLSLIHISEPTRPY